MLYPSSRIIIPKKNKKRAFGKFSHHVVKKFARRLKGSKTLKILTRCLSTQGLFDARLRLRFGGQVAEAEEGAVVVPDIPEVAEAEAEAAIRVSVHARHPVVAVGIFPKTLGLVERSIPVAFRQLVAFLVEDERDTLRTSVNCSLRGKKCYALLRGGRARHDLLERTDSKLLAGLQNTARVRKVRVGDRVVVIVELLAVLPTERTQSSRMVVVVGHRDDAEIHEQAELLG